MDGFRYRFSTDITIWDSSQMVPVSYLKTAITLEGCMMSQAINRSINWVRGRSYPDGIREERSKQIWWCSREVGSSIPKTHSYHSNSQRKQKICHQKTGRLTLFLLYYLLGNKPWDRKPQLLDLRKPLGKQQLQLQLPLLVFETV